MDLGGRDRDPDLAVLELVSRSGGDSVALELARGRWSWLCWTWTPTTGASVERSSC
jgi:hypothetical protein